MNVNGMNYLYYKDTALDGLVGARSTSLEPGSFTRFNTQVAHGATEAPILVKSHTSDTWNLWGDTFTPNGVFYTWQSSNLTNGTWIEADQRTYTQPLNSKHGTIQSISGAEYDSLVAHYGTPTWNRLKSYNFPDRYVRHAAFVGGIDQYPFDPYTDSQWKLVPGLADPAGVSFQSVNNPTRYLRHFNYRLQLDVNDGTTAFAQDATFHKTAGLADSTWTSFRSHNYPNRYIRHFNFELRIDPISTATGRSDATFWVGH